jgi:hypothetical protein
VNELFPARLIGGCLIVLGVAMLVGHRRAWHRQQADLETDESDRRHFAARYRRRMQTSGIIVLLGLLIPLGDWLFVLNRPVLSTLYWVGVLVLVGWVVLLGIGDFLSTSAHSRVALSRLHARQRQLEDELAALRSRHSNGRRQP